MGCVRFTERYLRSDPPTPEQIGAAVAEIEDNITKVLAAVPLEQIDRIVGVAGSVTTITAQALGLAEYSAGTDPRRGACPRTGSPQLARELLEMTRDQRAALPFMHPGRVDVIGAGALIWRTIISRMEILTDGRVRSAMASEHDILDGIALGISR